MVQTIMKKYFLIVIAIFIIQGCHQEGDLYLEFSGEVPLNVEFDDFGKIAINDKKISIKPLGYGHFKFKITYPSGKFIILNLCHQNNWYKDKLFIEKNKKDEIVIHHKNQEYDKVSSFKMNDKKVFALGICG